MSSSPRESRVRRVMQDTGMDYLQAYRHVQSQDILCRNARNDPGYFRKHADAVRRGAA